MFIRGSVKLNELKTAGGKLRSFVKRNKKNVAAGFMLLLLAGIAYAAPMAVVDTFFATGGWVEAYPDDVKKIIEAGHAFGNHSENHKFMTRLTDEQKKQELMKVHDKVKALTGYEMCLFRPPYGDYNDAVVKVADSLGYYTIQWSVDSLDWKDYGVDSIVRTVTQHKSLDSGAIILMHNGAKYTADALDSIITSLEEQGYSFVTVAELIHTGKYHMDHTGKQIADE